MKLSKRLSAIYAMVPSNAIVGDIGADHGLLGIHLVKNGIAKKVFCNENKQGPYSILKKAIESRCLNDKITASYSSGIEALPHDVDTLIIAGMGTELIINILDEHKEKLENVETLILSSHTLVNELRKYIIACGYMIDEEVMVKEKHFYQIIRFKKGVSEELSDVQYYFGPRLIKNRSPEFLKYYESRLARINELLKLDLKPEKRNELLLEKERIESL